MNGQEETGRPVQPEPGRKNGGRFKRFLRGFMSGGILRQPEVRRNLPYGLFVAFLMFLYIANGYHTQKLHRRYARLNAEVKELRTRSVSMTERRMTATRQSEIIRTLKERNIPLQESLVPPKVVE